MALPLGKAEDGKLEFKGAEVLKHPDKIAREAVAMLNAEGGEIWIGVREEAGFAVEAQAIERIESEMSSLLDHLVDTIEPSPSGEEIKIDVVTSQDAQVLRLRIAPDGRRRPYCQLRAGSGRVFVKRIGARIRPMSRDEILHLPSQSEEALSRATRRIGDEVRELQKAGNPVFWVRLLPVGDGDVGVRLPVDDASLGKYLTDYATTGNRPAGLNFASRYLEPTPGRDKLYTKNPEGRTTEIHSDGGIVFRAPLQEIARLEKDEHEIHPLSLLEHVTALFRLAATLYRDFPVKDGRWLLADAALIEIGGWKLRPGTLGPGPFTTRFDFHEGQTYDEGRDLVWEAPLSFELKELFESPDRCGFRLVRRVYLAFGHFEDAMPPEYDRDAGRLVLH